ncbi:hypothetical protein SEA_PIPPY_37 [Mycobacterium phage Pippy]|nr:hypothetical protein SEA_PIPPY_37 [Mycobacterium phage Pippy]
MGDETDPTELAVPSIERLKHLERRRDSDHGSQRWLKEG